MTRRIVRRSALLLALTSMAALPRPRIAFGQPDADSSGRPGSPRSVTTELEPRVEFTNGPPSGVSLVERMAYYHVPGAVIALIDGGRIAWVAGFGDRRAGEDSPVDGETIFAAKSLAKPLAATLALKLVDSGQLALDAPLADRLTSFTIPDNPLTRRSPPTLRHLLAHAAGFTRGGVDSYRPAGPLPTLLESLRGVAPAEVEPVTIDYEPGSDTRYSGGGYGVLQQLLVDATGIPFASLADSLLFAPLQMDHSSFPDGPLSEHALRLVALGHDDQGSLLPGGGYEILPIQAAGGLWTSAGDLARFLVAWMAAWRGEGGLLNTTMAHEMALRQFDDRGLGFEIEDHDGELAVLHTGSGDGFKAIMVAYPGRFDGAVVLANGDGAGELRYEILRAISREYDWPGFRDTTSYTLVHVPLEELARRAGKYRWESGLVSEMELRGGQLFYRFPGGGWQELFAIAPDRMVTTSNEIYVFEDSSLVYVSGDSRFRAERVES